MAELTVAARVSAPPERAFDAFLDPAVARRFLFATPEGEMIVAETDPRVGGRFRFVDRRPDVGEVEHVGEYVAIDRPRRLAFTFAVPQFDPAVTTVEVTFAAEGEGCVVTLRHTDVLPAWAEGTRQGWEKILAALGQTLEP